MTFGSEANLEDSTYKKVSVIVDTWLEVHKGETFDLDLVCRQLQITERENRHFVAMKLAYEVRQGKLEKLNRIYRYINKDKIYSKQELFKDVVLQLSNIIKDRFDNYDIITGPAIAGAVLAAPISLYLGKDFV